MIWRSGYRCFRQYRQCFFSRCLLRFLPGIFGTGLFRTDSRQGLPCFPYLNFAPRQLFGALGAVPYLIVALFCKREGGIGGGDIKLAGATGLVLGLPASLTASCLGLTGFVMYGCMVCLWNRFKGKRDKEAFPVGPFLAGGAAAVYCMRLGGWMI